MRPINVLAVLVATSWVPFERSHARHFSVYVSPSFSAEEHDDIVTAFEAWEVATGGFITLDFNASATDPVKNAIDVLPIEGNSEINQWGDPPHGISYTGITIDMKERGPVVRVRTDIPWDAFYDTALHEAGHAFDCDHVTDSGAVMFVFMGLQRGPLHSTITCADISELCRHWECEARYMPACISPVNDDM